MECGSIPSFSFCSCDGQILLSDLDQRAGSRLSLTSQQLWPDTTLLLSMGCMGRPLAHSTVRTQKNNSRILSHFIALLTFKYWDKNDFVNYL